MPKKNPYKNSNIGSSSSGSSSRSAYSPPVERTYTPTYSSSYSYSTNIGSKVFAILLPILTLIIGQIIQYITYSKSQEVLLLDLIFPYIPIAIVIISSILNVVNSILIAIWAWKFADDDELGRCWSYIIISGLFLSIIPCVAGFIGFIITIGIAVCTENLKEELIPWIIGITFLVFTIMLIWVGIANNDLKGIKLTKVNSFSEIEQYTDSEQVALDISNIDDSYCGTITTGEKCKTLIIVGQKKDVYRGLRIVSSATQITIKNINIIDGYFNFTADECLLKILGKNSINGIDGSYGGTERDGDDGTSTIIAKNLILTGNGRISLVAGSGGSGGNGVDGSDAFLFGNGGDGTDGGDGGDSAYTITCSSLMGNDFSGNISLKKGTPGSGGRGGDGGSGALFGSSGRDGWDGSSGKQKDYCSGKIELSDKYISYLE